VLSIRYKAVSQYASEDKLFSFLTQIETKQQLDGTVQEDVVKRLADEFQIGEAEAKSVVKRWLEERGKYTIVVPDANEFMESMNPGIDIHIFNQHPDYTIHVNRIDSFETFQRIYTLLGLLLAEDDTLFGKQGKEEEGLGEAEAELEDETLERESAAGGAAAGGAGARAMSLSSNVEGDGEGDEEIPEEVRRMLLEQSMLMGAAGVEEEVTGSAAAAAAPVAKKGTAAPATATQAPADDAPINPKSWFINKLQEIDPVLFKFTPRKAGDSYSRLCQANDDRQPSVLTQEKYDRMRDEYAADEDRGEIAFVVYPLEGTDDPKIPARAEVYTVLRFGSDPENPNYYFCPPLYCLRDEIMIRERDFAATQDREGAAKPPNTCPFCRGKLITDRAKPVAGHTVIRRKPKPKSTEQHLRIGFHRWDTKHRRIKDTPHPDELALPCCGIKDHVLRMKDSVFDRFRTAAAATAAPAKEAPDEEEAGPTRDEIEFAVKLETLHTEYILGAEKFPLYMGKFAVVPPPFDAYFGQKASNIIQRTAIRQEIKRNGTGFLRMGVENSASESLLAAIAPLVNRSYISEVKDLILEKIVPRIFINANFGNLVHEFYSPADEAPTQNELRSWASKHLQVDWNSENNFALLRIYLAYHRFVEFIKDSRQPKDLRHIAPLLAEPGLFTPRGVQLIVLDWNAAKPENPVTARCPSYGLAFERHKKADMAFISRSTRASSSQCTTGSIYATYEIFVHTDNTPGGGAAGDIHTSTIQWQYAARSAWPAIVRQRVDEFLTMCQSEHKTVYTSQSGINPRSLVSLSKAISGGTNYPEGVIRDSYNHAVALTYRTRAGKGVSPLAAFPVVDDGQNIGLQLRIHLDWDDFVAAPLEEVVAYYRETILPTFTLYKGYEPRRALQTASGRWALQLANGVYIPVAAPGVNPDSIGLEVRRVDHLEWDINQAIAEPCGSDPMLSDTTEAKLEELYQHFRLMVANWLISSDAGPTLRRIIEKTVFNHVLPEYEKRKRLDILLSGQFQSWFAVDEGQWELPTSFLRKDCRLIGEAGSCNGACSWSSEDGMCRLHVDAEAPVGSERKVSTPMLFIKRVIDELVRFPNRRRQILRGEVSELSSVIEAVREGDQMIIPEKTADPFSLLRLDWSAKHPEQAKHFEEMGVEEAVDAGADDAGAGERVPDRLAEFIGADSDLTFWEAEGGLGDLASILEGGLEEFGVAADAVAFDRANIVSYVKQKKQPLAQIDLRGEEPSVMIARPLQGIYDSLVCIVVLPDRVGLLIEYEGVAPVRVKSLPAIMRDIWSDPERVILVQLRKAAPAAGVASAAAAGAAAGAPEVKPKRILRRAAPSSEVDFAPEFSASAAAAPAAAPATPAMMKPVTTAAPATMKPLTAAAAAPATMKPLTAAAAAPATMKPVTAAVAAPATMKPLTAAAAAAPATMKSLTAAAAAPATAKPLTAAVAAPATIKPLTAAAAAPATAKPLTAAVAAPATIKPLTAAAAAPATAKPLTAAVAAPATIKPLTAAAAAPATAKPLTQLPKFTIRPKTQISEESSNEEIEMPPISKLNALLRTTAIPKKEEARNEESMSENELVEQPSIKAPASAAATLAAKPAAMPVTAKPAAMPVTAKPATAAATLAAKQVTSVAAKPAAVPAAAKPATQRKVTFGTTAAPAAASKAVGAKPPVTKQMLAANNSSLSSSNEEESEEEKMPVVKPQQKPAATASALANRATMPAKAAEEEYKPPSLENFEF
jgi:hypothetical protein